ncbi:hypothetical protein [Ahrensia sp. R2A130]|uniref:hypothetical protein n=1 Tax=Ahrensia sp. R2A130 TaxID=744979 RepID=UPI0001E0BCA8|nr:hypothetical protein [Ahrensia sp. R2A130]EFL88304.1 hypothetical protein R2A130_3471 [Ahrensia sp. R2A130]
MTTPTWETMREWCLQSAKTAERMPKPKGPAQPSTAWPAFPDDHFVWRGMKVGWSGYSADTTPKVRRPPPSPQDIADMERFIDLVNSLPSERDRKAIYMHGDLRTKKGRSVAGYCRSTGTNHGNYNRVLQATFQTLAQQSTVVGLLPSKSAVAITQHSGAKTSSSAQVERTYNLYESALTGDTRTTEEKTASREALIAEARQRRDEHMREKDREAVAEGR